MRSPRPAQIFADVLNDSAGGVALPARMVDACARSLPVTGAGLSVVTDRGPGGMLAASDDASTILEELQFSLGEGPCVESASRGRPVLNGDLTEPGAPWSPGFTQGALAAGVRAVFAFPLQVGRIRVGVLDLYRDTAGSLSDGHLDDALDHADAATLMLLHLHSREPLDDRSHGWASALEDRSVVHQATGMVSVQSDVTLEDALLLLRASAFAAERPIDAVARDVVDRAIRFDPEDSRW